MPGRLLRSGVLVNYTAGGMWPNVVWTTLDAGAEVVSTVGLRVKMDVLRAEGVSEGINSATTVVVATASSWWKTCRRHSCFHAGVGGVYAGALEDPGGAAESAINLEASA